MRRISAVVWVVGLGLAASIGWSATTYKLRFRPDVGTWVPYKVEMTGTMTMNMMGQGGEPQETSLRGRLEDKVVSKSEDGSRTLERTVTEMTMTMMGQERDLIADNGGPIVSTFVRDPHGILTKVGDQAPTDLALDPMNPGAFLHLAFIQTPTPDAEVSAGEEWDSADGMHLYAGISEIEAPTKLTSVSAGDPAFALTSCALRIVSSATVEQPGPDGQVMPIGLAVTQETQIDQQTAVSNGLVATSKQKGTIAIRIAFRGNPVGTVRLDPFESTVSFDEETYNEKKANQ